MPRSLLFPRLAASSLLILAATLQACIDVPPDPTPAPAVCALASTDPLRETAETRCDGVDNDCDGMTDVLLPTGPNACQVPGAGQCAQGFAACLAGARTCLAPPAIAEARNGLDDDCNGVTDDVPTVAARPLRLHVLVPPYLWKEQPRVTAGLADLLQAAGIPFDLPAPDAAEKELDFPETFYRLADYDVLYIPGYTGGWAISPEQLSALQVWVQAGGVLVMTKLVGLDANYPPEDQSPTTALLDLAGLQDAVGHKDIRRVTVTPTAPAALFLDSLEERDLPVNAPGSSPDSSTEVFTYQPQPTHGVDVFAQAVTHDGKVAPTWLRRPLGQGAVYTLGFDPFDYTSMHAYVNKFDPAWGVGIVLLRAVAREAGKGHSVQKHTVPGVESSVLLLTHDVDAPDAHNDNAEEWGEAGAVQMARMEKSLGVKGTYFVTTDYVNGYWNPGIPARLCDLGMCPDGGHSVQHQAMRDLPIGNCSVTQASYTPKQSTVCGEVGVCLQLLRKQLPAGQEVHAWRSPYLSVHPQQPQMLLAQGITYDSSYATGDWRSAFPGSTARHPFVDELLWRDQPLWTFPIAHEDGIGRFVAGKPVRLELQTNNRAEFMTRWKYALLQHERNGAWNVVLIHPSYGVGPGVTGANLAVKVDALKEFTQFALKQDIRAERITALGDFWRGRDGVDLKANWHPQNGYTGTLQVGPYAAPHFSLAFTDDLAQFDCPGAGPTTLRGGRVVFEQPLQPGQTYAFTAKPK